MRRYEAFGLAQRLKGHGHNAQLLAVFAGVPDELIRTVGRALRQRVADIGTFVDRGKKQL